MATSKKSTSIIEETVDTTTEVQFVEDVVIENTTATTTITDEISNVTTAEAPKTLLNEQGALTSRVW